MTETVSNIEKFLLLWVLYGILTDGIQFINFQESFGANLMNVMKISALILYSIIGSIWAFKKVGEIRRKVQLMQFQKQLGNHLKLIKSVMEHEMYKKHEILKLSEIAMEMSQCSQEIDSLVLELDLEDQNQFIRKTKSIPKIKKVVSKHSLVNFNLVKIRNRRILKCKRGSLNLTRSEPEVDQNLDQNVSNSSMDDTKVQAVILAAGRGSRMSQLVGSGSSNVPKCLIPLAGNPLIYYSLQYLAKSGFQQPGKDILIIIQEREDVRKVVEKISDRLKLPSVEVFCVSEDSDEFGTIESLKLAFNASKIKQNDILLMSCDAITDVPLVRLLNFHQSRDADFTCLFSKNLEAPTGKLPGPKIKIKQEKDIVGVDPSNSQLVFLASEADFEEDLAIPTQTMRKVPHIKLYTWLQDAHIYLLKRSILADHLLKSTKTNVKGEFIPQLIREQIENSSLNLYAFIQPENKTIRVNSTTTFSTANKSSFWIKSLYVSQTSSTPEIHESESFEKGKVKIPASAKVQSSTIGSHVILGEKCKIVNSIILDHVDIGEGSILENCIISSNSKIGENSTLKEVLVGPNYHVHSGSRYQNETLSAMEETLFEV